MKKTFAFLAPYVWRYKLLYFIGALAIIATNLCYVFVPKYIKKIIDIFNSHATLAQEVTIYQYAGMIIILGIGILICRTVSRICFFNPGRFIEFNIKNDTLEHLTYMQKDFFETHASGMILSRIQNDINAVRLLTGFGMMQLINIIVVLAVIPYQMVAISLPLTLYSLLPIGLVFMTVRIVAKRLAKLIRTRMQTMRLFSNFILSSLSGIDIVKNYMITPWCHAKFNKINQTVADLSIRSAFLRAFFMTLVGNLENLILLVALSIGSVYIMHNQLSIGDLIAFISYAGFITMPIMGTSWLIVVLARGIEGSNSLEEMRVQNIPPVAVRDQEPAPLGEFKELRVQNLSFAYRDNLVLDNVSFTIKKGESVGLFGQLGSGKTTLVNLLNHYLSIQPNTIFINNVDIATIPLEQLRSYIRTASQETFLFDNTVKENILLGLTKEEREKVDLKEILRMSAMDKEILRFPQHEETLVGEKGLMLSGGQKQRLSLARAFIRPCSLLILDNILSAVDTNTEHFLLHEIKQKTTSESQLLISHRVQAMEDADKIIVLDQGRIVDQGTFQELYARPGLFRDTCKIQLDKTDLPPIQPSLSTT